MAEAAHALSLLKQEILITDDVLSALSRCQSGTELNADARSAIKQALVVLRGKEEKLAKAREAVNLHQQLHAEVETLRQQVRAGEKRVQESARQLTEADAGLRAPLQNAKRLLKAGRQAEAAEVKIRDVVDYAQRISGITSAPSYWKPGMAMVGFLPPAPRQEMMRAGALSAFADTIAGNSLAADDLLRLVHDLDMNRQKSSNDVPVRSVNGGAGTGTGDPRNSKESEMEQEGWTKRRKDDEKRMAEDDEDIPAKPGRETLGNFAREDSRKRPKISLDLDDLDSESEEDDD